MHHHIGQVFCVFQVITRLSICYRTLDLAFRYREIYCNPPRPQCCSGSFLQAVGVRIVVFCLRGLR